MANITTQTIRVDLSTDKVIPSAFTHQNDTARTLVFDVYNGGMPYTMTGNTVKFAYKSPVVDGQYSVIAGSSMASGTVSGNKVTVALPVAYTRISGVGLLTMIITPSSGTIRPVNIRLVVQKSADGDDVVAGASDFPVAMQEYTADWLDDNVALFNDMRYTVDTPLVDGYWNAAGTASNGTNGESRTEMFPVTDASVVVLKVSLTAVHDNWCCCLFYDENNEPLERPTAYFNGVSSYEKTFTVPSGAAYASVSFRTFDDESMTYDVYYIGNHKNVFLRKIDQITEHDGYIGWNGQINTQDSTQLEKYTQMFSVDDVSYLYAGIVENRNHANAAPWMGVVTYDADGEFLSQGVVNVISGSWAVLTKINITSNVKYVAFTYRSYGTYTPTVYFMYDQMKWFEGFDESAKKDTTLPLRFKPCYDHLFVNRTGNDVTIPHESLYHVRLSKAFGYDVIEANLSKTSDGVFVVNHLSSGKFGGYFHHVDGTIDISNTAVSSVTWDWIVENVRYNSSIPKYRTRPCRLEEFLGECKQQGMIPFATARDVDAIAILDAYMGKDNYIAYGASRSDCPNATIYHWVTKTTKAEIVEYCKSIGTPFIYGMSNPNAFTDAELRDIVDTLHSLGYQIGVSYRDTTWHKLEYLGIDYNGSQGRTNRLEIGNYCNKNSTYGFDRDFTVLGATETDGVLTFTSNGSITPTMEPLVDNPIDYGIVDIEVSFNGTITIPAFGEHTASTSYTSDGTVPFFAAIPVIHGTLCCPINVTSGTIVYDVKYRASAL